MRLKLITAQAVSASAPQSGVSKFDGRIGIAPAGGFAPWSGL